MNDVKKPLIDSYDDIELKSEEVQEILGTPPSWIVRWGTVAIILTVIALGATTWAIEYPDVIPAPISISTSVPPVPIVSRIDGIIKLKMVEDNQKVIKDDLLYLMETSADYDDILTLEKLLVKLEEKGLTRASIISFTPPTGLSLGDIEQSFISFSNAYDAILYQSFGRRKSIIDKYLEELENLKKNINVLEEQEILTKTSLNIANKIFVTQKELYNAGQTNITNLEAARSEVSHLKEEIKKIDQKKITLENEIIEIERGILIDEHSKREDVSQDIASFKSQFQYLKSKINNWKQKYLIYAPMDGQVVYNDKFRTSHQYVKNGEKVMSIIPGGDYQLLAKASLPLKGSGKVKIGQELNIKLTNYPYLEYGTVKGIVISKSRLPVENFIEVEVDLPNGLVTSHDLQLEFEQQMKGIAEIITNDRRLFERIFEKFLSLFL